LEQGGVFVEHTGGLRTLSEPGGGASALRQLELAASATDHERLGVLQAELAALGPEREELETEWPATSELLES